MATTEISATTKSQGSRRTKDTGVLREGRSAHVMEDILSASSEACGAVRHLSLALSGTNLSAQVGLSALLNQYF